MSSPANVTQIASHRAQADSHHEIEGFFRQTRLWRHLDEDSLSKLCQISRFEHFSDGAFVLTEGEKNELLFFLVKGKVRIESEGEYIYTLKRKGDIIGEMSAITGAHCSANVIAEDDLLLLVVGRRDNHQASFRDFEKLSGIFYRLLAIVMTDKLKMTTHIAGTLEKENFGLHRDPLTGCWGQNKFYQDVETEKNRTLIYLKINKFNEVNDGLGFEAGNAVLIQVIKVISELMPQHGEVYRFFGSEFGILLQGNKREAWTLSEQIRDHINAARISFEGSRIVIHLSIGIASHQESGDLFKNAHLALGESKRVGRTVLFNEELNTQAQYLENIKQFNTVQEAFENNMFFPVYQGIRDNRPESPYYGKIQKYESLMRIQSPGREISPFFFLKALESSGEMTRATKLMIMKSFDDMAPKPYEFSINLTEGDLVDEGLVEFILYHLKGHKILPNRLTFEILEGVSTVGSDSVTLTLKELKKIGCKIAIDDFGAEQSNIGRLLNFEPDYIKIDAKFIKNLPTSKNSRIIVENVFDLATRMGAEVVAEFVENEEIQNIVEKIGIHYSQGYFFSKPSKNLP
ncbi:EAL domain-containing protein [Deltaproteobacteria bacterium TL4]